MPYHIYLLKMDHEEALKSFILETNYRFFKPELLEMLSKTNIIILLDLNLCIPI